MTCIANAVTKERKRLPPRYMFGNAVNPIADGSVSIPLALSAKQGMGISW